VEDLRIDRYKEFVLFVRFIYNLRQRQKRICVIADLSSKMTIACILKLQMGGAEMVNHRMNSPILLNLITSRISITIIYEPNAPEISSCLHLRSNN